MSRRLRLQQNGQHFPAAHRQTGHADPGYRGFLKIRQKNAVWAVHHSDKLPIKGVYSRQSALKKLEIHQVFLCFLP
ncbi:MAG: hypothetical protein J6Q92_06930 [Oscillospiraceae bacterium]|nr:hypothetical protein [Oscillospiraceae bacterium]